jgi:hypothetical protein
VLAESFEGILKCRVVLEGFPDQNVDVSRENLKMGRVQMQGAVKIEEVAKMVIHIDS